MRKIIGVWLIIFVIWGLYRLFFEFPETIDELIVKPLIFVLLPLIIFRIKKVPGFENISNVTEELLMGISAGFIFAFISVVANKLKYQELLFSPLSGVNNYNLL